MYTPYLYVYRNQDNRYLWAVGSQWQFYIYDFLKLLYLLQKGKRKIVL